MPILGRDFYFEMSYPEEPTVTAKERKNKADEFVERLGISLSKQDSVSIFGSPPMKTSKYSEYEEFSSKSPLIQNSKSTTDCQPKTASTISKAAV